MEDMDLKQAIHWHCHRLLLERIEENAAEIRSATAASASSDPAEATRARIRLEKVNAVRKDLEAMGATLTNIDPEGLHERIAPGALARTDMGLFYIAVALGRTSVNGYPLWVVAADAPIVQVLRDTPVGEIAFFNGEAFRMQQVA